MKLIYFNLTKNEDENFMIVRDIDVVGVTKGRSMQPGHFEGNTLIMRNYDGTDMC